MAAIQFLFLSADQDCSTNDVTFAATELLNLITLSVDDPHGLTGKTPGGKEPRVTTGKKRAPTVPNHEEARALQIAHALQEEREVLHAEQEARRHPVAPVEAHRRQAEEAYYRRQAELAAAEQDALCQAEQQARHRQAEQQAQRRLAEQQEEGKCDKRAFPPLPVYCSSAQHRLAEQQAQRRLAEQEAQHRDDEDNVGGNDNEEVIDLTESNDSSEPGQQIDWFKQPGYKRARK
jgi:hypothetical protein